MSSAARLARLRDERLPAVQAMLGDDAPVLLSAGLSVAGASVDAARPIHVSWRPGRSLAVVYDARVSNKSAPGVVRERIVAFTGDDLPIGSVHLEREGQKVAVWRLANDPWLPGLAVAMDRARARALLDGLGVPPGEVTPRLRSYRPGNRAVVELTAGRARLFIKAVRPGRASALQARHTRLIERLPVPRSHGWSEDLGVVVLEAIPGPTLREAFAARRPELPDPVELAEMLDRIPDLQDGRRPADWSDRTREHADLIVALLPEVAPRMVALLAACALPIEPGPLVPVHGDLHEAQLKVRGGRVVALLDVDSVSTGHRVDDWATLAGHLAVWGPSQPVTVARRAHEYLGRVLRLAEAQVDAETLRARIAAVIAGLATGPFRAQSPGWPKEMIRRIGAAERWAGATANAR